MHEPSGRLSRIVILRSGPVKRKVDEADLTSQPLPLDREGFLYAGPQLVGQLFASGTRIPPQLGLRLGGATPFAAGGNFTRASTMRRHGGHR